MKRWTVFAESKVGTSTKIMAMILDAKNSDDALVEFGSMFGFSYTLDENTIVVEGVSDDPRLTGIFNPSLLERIQEMSEGDVNVLLYGSFGAVFNEVHHA